MTTVHIAPLPIPELGVVVLRVDCSGGIADRVVIQRRTVADSVTSDVIAPAAAGGDDGTVFTVAGRAVVVDTAAPLDQAVVYLAAPYGSTPAVASPQVTLAADGLWRLGDPLRPDLDVTMGMTAPSPSCSTTQASIMCQVSAEDRQAKSQLSDVDNQASAIHVTRPTALPSYTVSIATRTDDDRARVEALLAPGGALLLRAPAGYGLGSRFLSVRQSQQGRLSADLRKPWRMYTLSVQEIDGVAGESYAPPGFRFLDACAVYASYTAAAAAGVSWSSAGYGVLGGVLPAAVRTMAEGAAAGRTFAQQTARGLTYFQRARDGA